MRLLFETFRHLLQYFRPKHVDAGSMYKGMATRLKLQPICKASFLIAKGEM
jgi:hypothetical protein